LTVQAALAALALTIVDEVQDNFVSDARGTTVLSVGGTPMQVGGDGLALNGFGFRPFAVQRPVAPSDQWIMALQNRDTNITTMAGIFVYGQDQPEG